MGSPFLIFTTPILPAYLDDIVLAAGAAFFCADALTATKLRTAMKTTKIVRNRFMRTSFSPNKGWIKTAIFTQIHSLSLFWTHHPLSSEFAQTPGYY
jgi:hypothetical protein